MLGTSPILEKPAASSPKTGDKLLMNQDNAVKQIDYDALATAILNKLSSQNFSSLSTSAKTVLGAVNELNSKSMTNSIWNENTSKTYKMIIGSSYIITYVDIGKGDIGNAINVGIITIGSSSSNTSKINWIVSNGSEQNFITFDESDHTILHVDVPALKWYVLSITKL